MSGKRKRSGKEAPGPASNAPKKAKKDGKPAAAQTKPTFEKAPFVETPTGDERRREAGLYDLLGSEEESDRLEAADCIVSSLLDGEGVSETTLKRHLDRRLFRGLSSGRNASRLGFSLVLTELLGQLFGEKDLATKKYSELTFDKVLQFLVEKAQDVGNVPGQEERDHFFGQLFGIECFVRSRILFRDISRWNGVLDLLLQLGYKKVWLRSQCGWVIVQAIEQMSQTQAEQTLDKITEARLAKTPEGVAIWIVVNNRFPKLKVKPWGHPLSKKSLGDLTAVLKENFQIPDQDQTDKRSKNKQANWTAQLHFVWDLILGYFVSDNSSTEDFDQFWSRVVDDGLFSKNATDGQKFKGFMVFQKLLAGLVDKHAKLDCTFSKNFMTCLMNQAAKEDRYLHRAATKALKALENTILSHPDALVPVLRCLISKHGAYSFDQRTNTKTVDRLLQNINKGTEEAVLSIIRQPLDKLAQQETSEAHATLKTLVDYLSKALTAASTSDDIKSDKSAEAAFGLSLQELARLAYSQPKEIPQALMTDQVKELCRSRLESSFAKLIRRSDDFVIFCNAVAAIDSSSVIMADEIKTAVEEALSRMNKLLKRKAKSDVEKSLSQGLAMLHAVSIFQLYNEDPDAMEVLQDLEQFSGRLKKGKLGEGGGGSSELLVEILLSMVARPSSLMRQVSHQVFEAFTSQISLEGLELLTGPLASGESTKGQQELFNTEDDGMDIGDEEEDMASDVEVIDAEASDFELDSDVEFVGINDIEGDEAEDDDENDDDENDDDEEEDDDNEDVEEIEDEEKGENPNRINIDDLDELVGNILNSHRLDKDVDAPESDNDADMSDSEMLALDEKLAEVFKNRVKAAPNSKKQKKDARQSVLNFKHRILDLLDIYVKNEPLNHLAFSLLIPLLNLMRTTSTKVLASRACEIILNHQKGLKKARSNKKETTTARAEDLLVNLVEVHEEATKDTSHAYSKAASAASLIIGSSMFAIDKAAIKQVAAVYAKTQSEWVLGEAKLQASFFADWNNWCQNQASQSHA